MEYKELVKVTGSLVCGTCQTDDIYIETAALNRHYASRHQKLSNYVCGQLDCRKQFRDLTSMIRHITTAHKILFEEENVQAGPLIEEDQGVCDTAMDTCLEDDDIVDDSDDTVFAHLGEEEFGNEEEDGTIQEQLDRAAVKLLLGLRTKASLTGAAVQRFEKGCYEMIQRLCASIKNRFTVRLQEKGLSAEDTQDVLSELESVSDPFRNLRTIDQQLDYFEKHYGLVKPTQKVLDTRIDMRLDPSTNSYVPTQVSETFQYVSVIKSLKTFLKNKKFRDLIFKKKATANDDVLRSYADGTHFKHHPYIQKHERVIQLILFFDELEIANSLGSKTIIHKLATFFCQVLNLPPEVSSLLSSIFLVALAHADDLKKKGAMDKVLAPLIHDLKKLAEGIQEEIDGEIFELRAVLVVLTADTLAAHDILGFLSSGAKHFCRRCMISRAEVRLNANAMGELRSREEHRRHIALVEARPTYSTDCGVKRSSLLDKAPFFDCTSSRVFDAFHDLLEGVVPLVLKLVTRHFVCKLKLFSDKDLNTRIKDFSYGIPDRKNNPSGNFSVDMLTSGGGKLKQTGSQMWCLMRAYAFLIADWVPEESPHMKLIFCLQNIMQIIFSFEIQMEDLDHLDDLMNVHNQTFQELFVDVPEEELYVEVPLDNPVNNDETEAEADDPEGLNAADLNMGERVEEGGDQQLPANRDGTRAQKKKITKVHVTNKLHHLKHYREMALAFGPPVRLWCAKFEGRMKIFRQHASICCNFKNPPLTMAKMFQLSSLSSMLGNSEEYLDFQTGNAMRIRNCSHRELFINAGFQDTDEVNYTNSATLHGEDYRPNLYVCLPGAPSTQIEFGLITSVIVASQSKEVFLVAKPWKNEGLSPRLNAYHVVPDNRPSVPLRTKSLRHFKCIAPWSPKGEDGEDSDELYLSLRTVLV